MIRNRQKNIRLNVKEEQVLLQKCFDLGITESDYFRSIIYDYMPNQKLNDEINKLAYEIRKIGVNLNQIAKYTNQTGLVNDNYLLSYIKKLDNLILELRLKVLDEGKLRR